MKFIISLLAGSVFMSLAMVGAWMFSVSTGQKVSAKTRYMMWIILLIGAIIPFRPVIGNGLIKLPTAFSDTTPTPADNEVYVDTTVDTAVETPKDNVAILEPTAPIPETPANTEIAANAETGDGGFKMPSLVQIIVFLWAVGAILFFGRYMLEYAKFHRLVKRWGRPVSDPDTLRIYEEVRVKMGLGKKKIALIRCNFINTPMLTGLLKPAILLPKEEIYEEEIYEEEMALILEHELTHYVHKDLWVNLLSIIAVSVHWFNPLVYMCLPTIYGDGESYCDETVLKNRDSEYRRFYGEVIISIIQHSSTKPIALSTCFFNKKLNIKRRLFNIMEKNKNRKTLSIAAIAGVLGLTIVSGSVLVFANQGKSDAVNLETAKKIALENAQVPANEATFVKAKKETGKGRRVYDIEFYANNVEYDYEIDIKTGRIVDVDRDIENFTIPGMTAPAQPGNDIGLEKAKQIALQNAGFQANNVQFVKAKKGFDDGRAVYDIEFYVNNVEYDYEIDAANGNILEKDMDIENFNIPVANTPAPTGNDIGMEKAKEIALQNAGLNAKNVQFVKAKKDYDDGRVIYDIEFYAGNAEYDYEIDALTGKILEKDMDIENFNIPVVNTPAPAQSGSDIGVEKAKQIALQNAGLNVKNVQFVKAKKDYDDGRVIYDIEFYAGNAEYDYEIDALTGKILEKDMDIENFNIPVTNTPAPAPSNGITIERAKQIALQHARLSGAQVSFIKAKLDRDDGRQYYDIEFKYNGTEYDYEIDPTNGNILSYDVDNDNDDNDD